MWTRPSFPDFCADVGGRVQLGWRFPYSTSSVSACFSIISSHTDSALHLRYCGDKGQNFALWELGVNMHVDEKLTGGDVLIVSFLRGGIPVIF